jgi:hypothetical protein
MKPHEPDIEIFGEVNSLQIDNDIYQIQPVEFNGETFFFIRRSDEVICMIMLNEKNEWEPDCNMGEWLFGEIMEYIHKRYL